MKFILAKDILNLSVNNTNSGDGKETLPVKFDHELVMKMAKYLIEKTILKISRLS